MLTLLVVAALLAGIFYYLQNYNNSAKPLLEKVKKVEAEIKAVSEVKDIKVTTEVVKKVRKPRAKKTTKKKSK